MASDSKTGRKKLAPLKITCTAFPAMFIFLLIAIYGLLEIPALTNHLFSGAAGADSGVAAAMVAYVSRG